MSCVDNKTQKLGGATADARYLLSLSSAHDDGVMDFKYGDI